MEKFLAGLGEESIIISMIIFAKKRRTFSSIFPHTMLDAELYMHGVALSDISGTSRKKSVQTEGLSFQIKAYIFDARLPDDLYYEDRKEYIEKMYKLFLSDSGLDVKDLSFSLLPYKVGNNMDEITEYYNLAI